MFLAGTALFAWTMPDGAKDAAAPEITAVTTEVPNTTSVEELILPRADDGHFYAEVTVDGAHATMLVDTGASVIALTGEDARAIGINWEPGDVRPVARGANGAVHGVHVTLDAVRLGDFEADGVAAIVVPEGLPISLLGQSFLSRIERVQIGPREMMLGG